MLRQTRLQPMVAGGTLHSPMTENFRVCEVSPSVSSSVSVPDIQTPFNESERFEIDAKQPENRPGMFSRMSCWFRTR